MHTYTYCFLFKAALAVTFRSIQISFLCWSDEQLEWLEGHPD